MQHILLHLNSSSYQIFIICAENTSLYSALLLSHPAAKLRKHLDVCHDPNGHVPSKCVCWNHPEWWWYEVEVWMLMLRENPTWEGLGLLWNGPRIKPSLSPSLLLCEHNSYPDQKKPHNRTGQWLVFVIQWKALLVIQRALFLYTYRISKGSKKLDASPMQRFLELSKCVNKTKSQ